MIDDADRCPELAPGCQLLEQPLLRLRPEFRHVGELLAVDDDQQVIVRKVAADRILDPVAARVTAEQDDLEQLPAAQGRHRPARDRKGESVTDRLHDKGELALFAFGQTLKTVVHRAPKLASLSSKNKRNSPPPNPSASRRANQQYRRRLRPVPVKR